MKTLSIQNLIKRYDKLGIKANDIEMLHKYMLCFSNLYGCLDIKNVWKIFKQYESKFSKEKFYDFVDVAQRDEKDYLIVNLNEAFTGETSTNTEDKLLINKSLVKKYRNKYWDLHKLENYKDYQYGPYIPSKEELFKFDHDTFYETETGKAMFSFVCNLKLSGYEINKYRGTQTELLDIDGNKTKDRLFKDVICLNCSDNFLINYCKNEKEREYIRQSKSITCAQKTLDYIKYCVLIDDPRNISDPIEFILDYITYDYGANFSEKEAQEFLDLYSNLCNTSNRWSMFGYSPNDLRKKLPINKGPIELQIGPNIQKMIDSGEYNLKELEDYIKNNNLNMKITKQSESCEDIVKENEKYLEIFKKFLEKRNYREKTIEDHISRVDYYINDYLMWGLPKHMKEGCSLEFVGFIENRVNEKMAPASVHNIDFYLTSINLFYECMVEKKIINRDLYKEFVNYIKNTKDELVEDYYDKNPKKINIYDVIEAIELADGYGTGYINIKTNEKEFVPEDESLYFGDIDELYDKIDGHNWVRVPEINDYEIMTKFVLELDSKEQSEKLYDILHQRKAYRNFKDAIYEMGIEDDYYDYYELQIEKLAENWLKDNVDYIDEFDDEDDGFSESELS